MTTDRPFIHQMSLSEFRFRDLPSCPEFHPTVEEFADPMSYISSIRSIAELAGICRIIPPKEAWIDASHWLDEVNEYSFAFTAKQQNVHLLMHRDAVAEQFVQRLGRFWEAHDPTTTFRVPLVFDQPAPLYLLYQAVQRAGGYELVTRNNAWRSIVAECCHNVVSNKRVRQLRDAYERWLVPFENSNRLATTPPIASSDFSIATSTSTTTTTTGTTMMTATTPPTIDVDASPTQRRRPVDSGVDSFGFGDGGKFTLSSFRTKADKAFRSYFGNRKPAKQLRVVTKQRQRNNADDSDSLENDNDDDDDDDADDDGVGDGDSDDNVDGKTRATTPVDVDEIEEAFWRIVESGAEAVVVPYGSDLSVVNVPALETHARGSNHHTLFPCRARAACAFSPWNLNHLPRQRGSLLRYIRQTLPGITNPHVYVGMMFSSFCWHTEDNYLASISYLHGGAPKVWYGIPSSDLERFELAMRAEFPNLFASQPDLLFQLITHLTPRIAVRHGVKVVRSNSYPSAVQRAGEFIVTFPATYHAGFNSSFNVAEAVNFAPSFWLPWGAKSLLSYHNKSYSRLSSFSFHALVCNAIKAVNGDASPDVLAALKIAFVSMIENQRHALEVLSRAGIRKVQMFPRYVNDDVHSDEDLIQCHLCKIDSYMVAVVCPCSTKISCVNHWRQMCRCATSQRFQVVRYSERDLLKMLETLNKATASTTPIDVKKDALFLEQWRNRTAASSTSQKSSAIKRVGDNDDDNGDGDDDHDYGARQRSNSVANFSSRTVAQQQQFAASSSIADVDSKNRLISQKVMQLKKRAKLSNSIGRTRVVKTVSSVIDVDDDDDDDDGDVK